jgi:hypothetical protein
VRPLLFLVCVGLACVAASAHDIITTPITWSREISRIIFTRCASCHREGGSAFSLTTYKEARPWVVAIREEILRRHMPPWGAVKGFGDFRNDQALTQEEIELIVNWSEGGVPEGEAKDLPREPKFEPPLKVGKVKGEIVIKGTYTLPRKFTLDGIVPVTASRESMQIVAEFPDGSIEPLLWLQDYRPEFAHPFLLRKPLALPARTVIRGVPAGASIRLLPAIP